MTRNYSQPPKRKLIKPTNVFGMASLNALFLLRYPLPMETCTHSSPPLSRPGSLPCSLQLAGYHSHRDWTRCVGGHFLTNLTIGPQSTVCFAHGNMPRRTPAFSVTFSYSSISSLKYLRTASFTLPLQQRCQLINDVSTPFASDTLCTPFRLRLIWGFI